MAPPIPPNESERLAALQRYRIQGSPAAGAPGDAARLATRLFSAPMALVSLVDGVRVSFPGAYGLELSEVPREGWFCSRAILSDEVLVVGDAFSDARFRENALVRGAPCIRFYAGAPLTTPDGFRLGALSILDTAPRPEFSADLRGVLKELAAAVMDELGAAAEARPGWKLPLSEEILTRILDALPVGVWVADKHGTLLHGNPAGRRIWGGDRYVGPEGYGEYVGWRAETGERIQAEEWALARAVTRGETSLDEVIDIQTFDGLRKTILNSAAPLRGPAGELVGGVVVNQDITGQRRAQEAIHRISDELRGIIDASPLAIVTFGRDRSVQSWSPAAEQIFGWKAEEVIGHPYPIVPDGYERQFESHCECISRGDVLREVETRRKTKDGKLVDVRISAAPLHNPSGEITGIVAILSDITAGKEAERALAESEERYRNLVERSPIGIAIHCDGKIVYVNAAVLHMFGAISADELLGREPAQFVDPPSRAAYQAMIDTVLETGQPVPVIELTLRRPDGAAIYAEVASLAFSFQGRPAVQVVIRDITDRRRAEEKAREHQRDLATLVDNLPALVVVKDRNSNFLVANRKFCEEFGVSPDEIRGKSDFDFSAPDLARKFRADDARVMASGTTSYFEETLCLPGRGEIEIGTVKAPLRDDYGKVRGIVGMVFELTEKRAMEAALQQSEERFRRAVLEAPVPIMIHAQDGRILQLNRAWLEQSGYAAEDLRTVEDWITKARRADEAHAREQFCTLYQMEAGAIGREVSIRTGTGKQRTWTVSSAPLGPMPDGARVVITMGMDITERRSLEQQLAQSQKMEAIGQLAGGVAHDFNNLLTVISGYSNFLLQSLPEIDPATTQVKEIAQAADRATTLTRQLLAFSRKQILRPANVDINQVIHESERMLRRLIGEDIEIRLALAPTEMRSLVDAGQLTQVVMNLVVNARDAMPEGGVLTIETSAADLSAEYAETHPGLAAGRYVRLGISDTGVGMDAATRERIFEPFFTTKGPGSGTGLGLSMVYGIVKQSNGHIRVYSEPGRGTTFQIYLPRVFERPEAVPTRPAAVPAGGGETILLVEDEPALRKLTREILRRAGYKVIETASGGEALLACEQAQGQIALLITDLVMPGMSGRELAKRLEPLRQGMHVLFMSGYSNHAALASGILDGQVPFLQKPFTPAALVEKVRQVLSQA